MARVKEKTRSYIAYIAARLLEEQAGLSIEEAKKKAAKQVGESRKLQLPSDSEVEEEFKSQNSIFHDSDLGCKLRELRIMALEFMHIFKHYDFFLTGGLLRGASASFKEINFHCYVDNGKDIEFFLINENLQYSTADRAMWIGNIRKDITTYLVHYSSPPFAISVFSRKDFQEKIRVSKAGDPLELANSAKVESLLSR